MSVAQSYSKVNNLIEEMKNAAHNNSWEKYDELGVKHQYERMLLEEKQEKLRAILEGVHPSSKAE